ncbi:MAG: DUF4345 family protein [Pseudomonadota bacterium]
MEMVIQGLIALIALALSGLGIKSMFAPASMVKNFAIEPVGAAGLNTIRGMIGGLFLGCLAMLVAGFAMNNTVWFLAVAVILGAVAIGRVIGILLDGFEKSVIPPLVVELVMVAILVTAHMQLGAA